MRQPPVYNPTSDAPVLIPDHILIETLTEHGMPAKDARVLKVNAGLRLMATRFYFDVADAAKGNKAAKERVDFCRGIWSRSAERQKQNNPQVSISVPSHI